jgi:2-amino-4-hydroxy-6-hydroxymethyldihydropteridine diphosphokinase
MADHATRHRAYIALGSNIEPEANLPIAVEELSALGEVKTVSQVYESPPVDGSNQENYLNAAVLLLTDLSAETLCRQSLPAIEADLGRIRDPENKNGPRTIDLDLVLYNDDVLTIDHRRIPDPEIASRPFLAIPLAELEATWHVPGIGRTLGDIAESLAGDSTLTVRPDVQLRRNP